MFWKLEAESLWSSKAKAAVISVTNISDANLYLNSIILIWFDLTHHPNLFLRDRSAFRLFDKKNDC